MSANILATRIDKSWEVLTGSVKYFCNIKYFLRYVWQRFNLEKKMCERAEIVFTHNIIKRSEKEAESAQRLKHEDSLTQSTGHISFSCWNVLLFENW